MGPVEFAIWRFRNAEGVMDYVKTWNLTGCTLDVKGKAVHLVYDAAKETVTITEPARIFASPITVRFDEFVPTMTKLGYYVERTTNRHNLSYKVSNDDNK